MIDFELNNRLSVITSGALAAASEGWSVRTLQRNISSQYYERTLRSQHKEVVRQTYVLN